MTIEELIDLLELDPRGKVFLINLCHTLKLPPPFVSAHEVRIVLLEFINDITAGGHPLPTTAELTDRLGETCVARNLWLKGPEPILERHLPKHEYILSRVVSYSGFFYSILGRRGGMRAIPGLPEPSSSSDEIDATNISKVRHTINSGKWRSHLVGDVKLGTNCIWLAPLVKIKKKVGLSPKKQWADIHRDIIGLSHLRKGQHLIRIDLDLKRLHDLPSKFRRRPHGAGNGSNRFRLNYDGQECACCWGRTVNLARVASGSIKSLNGIPELLMESFSISKTAVYATYLGQLKHPPEHNDSFFIRRLSKKSMMSTITSYLKSALT